MRRIPFVEVLVFVCGVSSIGFGQRLTFGVKAAGRMTDAFANTFSGYAVAEDRFAFGPAVEVGLPRRLSFEVDALHKRLNYSQNFFSYSNTFQSRETKDTVVHTWKIPVLVKWHASETSQRSSGFIVGGFSLQHITGSVHRYGTDTRGYAGLPTSTVTPFDLRQGVNEWTHGLVAGTGIDWRVGFFHLTPELRYTRWINAAFENPNQNAFEILAGFAFGK